MTRRIDPSIPLAYAAEPRLLLSRASQTLQRAIQAQPGAERFGALLLGPTGAGKSSAAAWALRRWQAAHPAWVPAPDPSGFEVRPRAVTLSWLDALEATDAERRYKLGTGDPEDLDQAYRADWLVLDDVGLSSSASLVQLVLARRYQACLPTIVTSGLTPDQLSAHIGAASVRRVVEFEGKAGLFVNCHARAAA